VIVVGAELYACAGAIDLGDRVRAGGKEGIGSPERRHSRKLPLPVDT